MHLHVICACAMGRSQPWTFLLPQNCIVLEFRRIGGRGWGREGDGWDIRGDRWHWYICMYVCMLVEGTYHDRCLCLCNGHSSGRLHLHSCDNLILEWNKDTVVWVRSGGCLHSWVKFSARGVPANEMLQLGESSPLGPQIAYIANEGAVAEWASYL